MVSPAEEGGASPRPAEGRSDDARRLRTPRSPPDDDEDTDADVSSVASTDSKFERQLALKATARRARDPPRKKTKTNTPSSSKKKSSGKKKSEKPPSKPEPERKGLKWTPQGLLLVSKAVMKASVDQIKGTDKKATVLWGEAHGYFEQARAAYNDFHANTPDFVPVPYREEHSVKGIWNSKIQPAVNKFAGIVASNPPDSGETINDEKMKLYWSRMTTLSACPPERCQ